MDGGGIGAVVAGENAVGDEGAVRIVLSRRSAERIPQVHLRIESGPLHVAGVFEDGMIVGGDKIGAVPRLGGNAPKL